MSRSLKKAAIVDWEEVAEHFVLFLQAAMLKSSRLQQVVSQIRLGQMCVLALWWAYFKYSTNSISRPSTVTTLFLEKKQYIPVDAVIAPEKPYFATVPLLGRPVLTAPRVCQLCGAGFRDWASLVGHCKREAPRARQLQRIPEAPFLGGREVRRAGVA